MIRAILLHFWLAYDHPFEDGNGRTARILFFWLDAGTRLLAGRVPADLANHLAQRTCAVRKGVPGNRDRRAATRLTSSFTSSNVIAPAIDELHLYLARKIAEVKTVERLLHGADHFNQRQLALLTDALRDPDASLFLRQSCRASHRVTHETARADLRELLERDLLPRRRRSAGSTSSSRLPIYRSA